MRRKGGARGCAGWQVEPAGQAEEGRVRGSAAGNGAADARGPVVSGREARAVREDAP